MPLKLNVGIQKKHGQPNYSSVGASCHVELELDQSLLVDDLDGFHDRIRRTYAACRDAVEAELNRQLAGDADCALAGAYPTSGHSSGRPFTAGELRGVDLRPASQRQIDYIEKLASQIRDLDDGQFEALTNHLFGKPASEMSCLEASNLIVVLQDLKSGRLDLEDALDCAA
jgi:hypothetical protein